MSTLTLQLQKPTSGVKRKLTRLPEKVPNPAPWETQKSSAVFPLNPRGHLGPQEPTGSSELHTDNLINNWPLWGPHVMTSPQIAQSYDRMDSISMGNQWKYRSLPTGQCSPLSPSTHCRHRTSPCHSSLTHLPWQSSHHPHVCLPPWGQLFIPVASDLASLHHLAALPAPGDDAFVCPQDPADLPTVLV